MSATIVHKKLNFIAVLLALLGLFVLVAPTSVSAQFDPLEQACEKANAQSEEICENSGGDDDPLLSDNGVFTDAVNVLSLVGGIIAVIVIVISGIRLITSNGDSSKIATTRDTIIYAAVGIVVIVLARTIVIAIANRL